MRTVSLRQIDMSGATIPIGYEGENEFTQVRIDCKKTFQQYPEAVASLSVKDPTGRQYSVAVVREGTVVVWNVIATDVPTRGSGEIQIVFLIDGTIIARSAIAKTIIKRSIDPNGGGGGGTGDYNDLTNKPSINGHTLQGSVTLSDIGALSSDALASAITEALTQAHSSGAFDGADGVGIESIARTGTVGLVDTYTITLTDNSTYIFTVTNGADGVPGQAGTPGADGYSPTVTVTTITGGHRVVITDADGDHSFDVLDGQGGGGSVTVDDALSTLSENPVQNKVVKGALDTLTSAIAPLQNSTATGVDLDVSDEDGNVVLRIADGNVRTKNFISDNGIYESQFEYDNTAGTETITHFFPKGTRLAFHLTNAEDRERDGIADYSVTYKYTTPNGSTYTLGTAYGFNFPEYVLPNDAASVSVQYGTGLNWGSDATLSFKVYSIGSIPRQPHIITVGTGKDYTSIRAAVEYARQYADELNRYEIRIDAGTYDIMSYYTAEEIATEGFIGLMVSNGISLVGMGQRSEVILTATLSTSDYNETKRNWVSTLNIRGNTSIRNMTIKAENIRYAVHDDSSMFSDQNDTHIFDCVTFVGKSLTSSNDSDLAYGAGGANLKKLFFFNCEFSDALTLHTSDSLSHEYTAYFINCRARMMQFGDYNSGIPTHIYLKNCNVARIKIGTSGSHNQFMLVEGEGTNGVMIASPSGYVYALDEVHKFVGSNVTAGKAVKLSTNMKTVSAADSLNSVYGVSIGVLDGVTYVQTEGWLNSNTLGLSNLSVGDYLTINTSTGAVEVGTSANAIAQVKHVDSDSVAYAKLI